jgi:hypothetical protein
VSSVTVTSTSVSSIRRRSHATPKPPARPTTVPPAATRISSTAASPTVNAPAPAAATATFHAVRAVASLTRFSPSTRLTTRSGAPRRRKTAVAATRSVGATTVASTHAAAQLRSSTSACAATATTAIVIVTSTTAASAIGRASRSSRRGEAW